MEIVVHFFFLIFPWIAKPGQTLLFRRTENGTIPGKMGQLAGMSLLGKNINNQQ